MVWSRARVPDIIPLGCYMIAYQVHTNFLFYFILFFRSLYNLNLVSIEYRGVF